MLAALMCKPAAQATPWRTECWKLTSCEGAGTKDVEARDCTASMTSSMDTSLLVPPALSDTACTCDMLFKCKFPASSA